jgi:hypothetical protein
VPLDEPNADCLEDEWTQAQIDCYVVAPTVDRLTASLDAAGFSPKTRN